MRAAIPLFLLLVSVGCGGGNATSKGANTSGSEEPASTAAASAKMPGDCVDPVIDGDRHDSSRPFDKHVQQDVRDEDLDGDGVVDSFVKPAWACGEACKRSAYVMRGTCGHYVGSFPSDEKYYAQETKSNGLKDLSTHPRRIEDDNQMHCYEQILKFDGTQYQLAKKRECKCDNEKMCAAWDE
jgi:hypothetical protein